MIFDWSSLSDDWVREKREPVFYIMTVHIFNVEYSRALYHYGFDATSIKNKNRLDKTMLFYASENSLHLP
jgi:hypothetical protein